MALTVSQLAAQSGVTPHTVRYYEQVGLLPPAERSPAGYRLYEEDAVGRLRFVKGARRLGLSVKEARELLAVHERGLCPCGHAEAIVRKRLADVEVQVERLAALRDELAEILRRYPAEGCPDEQAIAWPCAEEFIKRGGDTGERAPLPTHT